MSSLFAKGFKASNCKTMLKLTIPRIKLLRNRKEVQLKQMRRDIAKLLETGQEATARIRVEHIIREEKMMAAQEIIELFSELIVVRLPIIEAQRECPLDLKEAISSVCFAAPRCADLPELQQVHMLFAAKYGKEFVAAAAELMPECGVNRQLVELLSVNAPDPEVKLKLLKDIAEEHGLDWDPTASETELLKPCEDLLNGPTQFVSGSQLPLPKQKHDDSAYVASKQSPTEEPNTDDGFETIDFPVVPKTSLKPIVGTVSAPNDADSDEETLAHELESVEPKSDNKSDFTNLSPVPDEASKQYVPFVSPLSSTEFSVRESEPAPSQPLPRSKSGYGIDLKDVLAAAHAAADSAERAAAAARSAATLAQVRISELVKKRSDEIPDGGNENPFHSDTRNPVLKAPALQGLEESDVHNPPFVSRKAVSNFDSDTCEAKNMEKLQISKSDSSEENTIFRPHLSPLPSFDDQRVETNPSFPSYYYHNVEFDSSELRNDYRGLAVNPRQPQRLPSMDDEYLSYPNLFTPRSSNIESGTHASEDASHPSK